MESSKSMPGLFDLIKKTLTFYKAHYKKLIPIGLVFVVLGLLTQIFSFPFYSEEPFTPLRAICAIITALLVIVTTIFQLVLPLIYTKTFIQIESGHSKSLKEIYKIGLKKFFPILWLFILNSLLVLGASVFLVIPGIVSGIFTSFSLMVLADEDKRGLSALTTSFYYVTNNFWRVLGRLLGFGIILVAVAGILAGIVGFIVHIIDPVIFSFTPEHIESLADRLAAPGIATVLIGIVMGFVNTCVIYPIALYYTYDVYKHLKISKSAPHESFMQTVRAWFLGLSIFGGVVTVAVIILAILIPVAFIALKPGVSNEGLVTIEEIKFASTTTQSKLNVQDETSLDTIPYSDPEFGFSMRLPRSWAVVSSEISEDGVVVIPPDQNIQGKMQIQTFDVPITSDEEAQQVAAELIFTDENVFKEPAFNKIYIGPLLAYGITEKVQEKNAVSGIEYYLIPNQDKGFYLITLNWKGTPIQNPLKTLLDSVATFKVAPVI